MEIWIQSCIVAVVGALWARLVWTQNKRDRENREEIAGLRSEIVAVRTEMQTVKEHMGELTTLARGVKSCPVPDCPYRTLAGQCVA